MKNFHFYYYPKKLETLAENINMKLKNEQYTLNDLKRILKNILDCDEQAIKMFNKKKGYSFKKKLLEYGFRNYTRVHDSKNMYYLLSKNLRKSIGPIIEIAFLNFYDDDNFYSFFNKHKKKINDYINENLYELINRFNKNDIRNNIGNIFKEYYEDQVKFNEMIQEYQINMECKLYQNIMNEFYLNCSQETLLNLSIKELNTIFINLNIQDAARFVNNYFKKIDITDYIEQFFKKIFHIYGSPEDKMYRKFWGYINKQPKLILGNYFKKFMIEESFGNDRRSDFWKQLVHDMQKVIVNKTSKHLYMYFEKFVVIEFIQKGNAAYVYETEIFEENFEKIIINRKVINNETLKNKDLCLFKFNHSGNWERRLINQINRAML